MSRLCQNERNYVAVFLIEAPCLSSSWGRFLPRYPIRGAEWTRSPTLHFKVKVPLGTEGVLSYLLWDKLSAGSVENNGPLLWPFLPTNVPSRYLSSLQGHRSLTPSYNVRTVISSPPCDQCASARNGALRYPHYIVPLTSHRLTTLNSVVLELSPTSTRYFSQLTWTHLHDRLGCAAQHSHPPPRNGTSLHRRI
jgi:hypothetical protein